MCTHVYICVCIRKYLHFRGPKDHINIRTLQTLISGIPLILGLGTRVSDPYVYVVSWAPIFDCRALSALRLGRGGS